MTAFTSWMPVALQQARNAMARGEVPVGAVIVSPQGKLVAAAGNETRARHDPTAHAEILVIRDACRKVGNERLEGHSLWVTLEPCPMCAAAIAAARITTLYYGASDPKSGGVETGPCIFSHSAAHHQPQVINGLEEAQSAALLREFFVRKRIKT